MISFTPGQPAVYEEMSAVLFVNGCLTVMAGESDEVKHPMFQHLQELMEDSEVCGWESVM